MVINMILHSSNKQEVSYIEDDAYYKIKDFLNEEEVLNHLKKNELSTTYMLFKSEVKDVPITLLTQVLLFNDIDPLSFFHIIPSEYDFAGYNTEIIDLYFYPNITAIGEMSFAENKALTTFRGSESLVGILKYAFNNAIKLKSVDLHRCKDLSYLPVNCFAGCTHLTSVILPPNIQRLEPNCLIPNKGFHDIHYYISSNTATNAAFMNRYSDKYNFEVYEP